jgi:hypothetical protein
MSARRVPMEAAESHPKASPGDRVIIHGHHQGEHPRDGEILEVHGEDGAPPYVVRWADGRVGSLYPGSDVRIQHLEDDD